MNVQSLGNCRVPLTAGGAASVPVIRDIVYMAEILQKVPGFFFFAVSLDFWIFDFEEDGRDYVE